MYGIGGLWFGIVYSIFMAAGVAAYVHSRSD
jgi:hypothetical protein